MIWEYGMKLEEACLVHFLLLWEYQGKDALIFQIIRVYVLGGFVPQKKIRIMFL